MRFVASPEVLRAKGQELVSQSELFNDNVIKIYESVNKMVNTDYLSPEARAIANDINSYKADLDLMTKTIKEYGAFCMSAGNKVMDNQYNITSGIN